MQKLRDSAALIAALVLFALGLGLLLILPIVGTMFAVLGLGIALWQGRALWQARQSRYDLKTLWDAPLPDRQPIQYDDQPDESALDDPDTMAYCHLCGHAVPLDYSRCPECGNPL